MVNLKHCLTAIMHLRLIFTGTDLSDIQKEDIIKDITLFGAEPKMLKARLERKYPGYESQFKALLRSLKM